MTDLDSSQLVLSANISESETDLESPSDTYVSGTGDQPDVAGMRLLFVVDSKFPGPGGAESQARKLALCLRDAGAHIDFVAPANNFQEPSVIETEGFTVRKLRYPNIRFLGGLLVSANYALYLLRHRKQYDAIHLHIAHQLAIITGFFKPLVPCPVVAKVSGYFEFVGVLNMDKPGRDLSGRFKRWCLHRLDFMQAISQETIVKLEAAGFDRRKIRFIPNGISILPVGAGVADRTADGGHAPTVFGYCGRMREVKGVHVLLDAFAEVLKQRPDDALLHIAGDGYTYFELQQQAEQLGIADKVDFQGYQDDTAAFYNDITVYVQPSFAEGLPNSVLEAMNHSLPVVATRVGGNNDLVNDLQSGYLCVPGDTAELTRLMLECLNAPSSALRKMGESGYALMYNTYGFASVTAALGELYRGDPATNAGVMQSDFSDDAAG